MKLTAEFLSTIPRLLPAKDRYPEYQLGTKVQDGLDQVASSIESIECVRLSNAVINCTTLIKPCDQEQRAVCGNSRFRLLDVPEGPACMDMASTSQNVHFQCDVVRVQNPTNKGCVMVFKRDNMNRSGVQRPESALLLFCELNYFKNLPWITGLAVANYVVTMWCKQGISPTILEHPNVTQHYGKYSSVNLNHTALLPRKSKSATHLKFNIDTGVQKKSMAIHAGVRTSDDIIAFVVEFAAVATEYAVPISSPRKRRKKGDR
jgi:hypothetical protein